MTELFQFTLFGLMLGCVYAIAAMGLVLTYTVTGVFNFAHGAVGMLAAFIYFELRVNQGVPTPIAIAIVVLVLAPLMGLGVERLLRRFQGADYATSLVVTVALTVGLLGLAQNVFDPGEARNLPVPVRRPAHRGVRRADHLRPDLPGRRGGRRRLRACGSCSSARRSGPACGPSSTTASWPA